ncbi:MAG: FHA domain-containing protein, partial [Pseudomonadota bacterium]
RAVRTTHSTVAASGWRFDGAVIGDDDAPTGAPIRFTVAEATLMRVYLGIAIGRHPGLCEIAIPDASLSRRHARLTRTGDGLAIEDLHSLNGVWIDGRRLPIFKPTALPLGAELVLARARLSVARC